MPRTRRQAAPAATIPQRRASTDGRAVLLAPGILSPRKITIKGTPAARRRFAAQTLDTDLPRQDLGTYQEDGRGLERPVLDNCRTSKAAHALFMLASRLGVLMDIELCDRYGDAALATAGGTVTDLRGSFSRWHGDPSYLPLGFSDHVSKCGLACFEWPGSGLPTSSAQ
jgi:hypothetical protein